MPETRKILIPPLRFNIYFALCGLKLVVSKPAILATLAFGWESFFNNLALETPINRKLKNRVLGFNIFLDNSRVASFIGFYRWWGVGTVALLRAIVRNGNTVVDVGAHLGWYAFIAAKAVGDQGLVISFEPEPSTFQLLSKSIKSNKFMNVVALERSISTRDGVQTLHVSPQHAGHSLVRDFKRGNIQVTSSKLDTIASGLKLGTIDLLKVDVEGAEPEVIESAKKLIDTSHITHIVMEWNPEAWTLHYALLESLASHYDFYWLESRLPFSSILKISIRELPPYYGNLFLSLRH